VIGIVGLEKGVARRATLHFAGPGTAGSSHWVQPVTKRKERAI
jgi:hypothetical protein